MAHQTVQLLHRFLGALLSGLALAMVITAGA
jgi:hypothetical protein